MKIIERLSRNSRFFYSQQYFITFNGSSTSFLVFIIKLLIFLSVITAGLFYFNKINYKSEYVEQIKERIEKIETQFEMEMRQDTIWKIIKSKKIQGDTVFIKNQQELDSFYYEIGEE